MTTTKIPSLDALPVVGIEDDLQPVRMMRQKLNASFVMIDQILAAPSGLSSELKTNLNTVRFHITTALSAIDTYLYTGNSADDPAGDVPNLMTAVQLHITALRQAKPSWDNWVKTVNPPEVPAPLTASANSISPASALDVTEPTPLNTYLAIGGIAIGAFILWKILE